MNFIKWFAPALACSIALYPGTGFSLDEPKKEADIKCNIDRLDKSWNLDLKNFSVKDGLSPKIVNGRLSKQLPVKEFWMTFAFSKDVQDAKAVRKAIVPFSTIHNVPAKNRPDHIVGYLFDAENVVIRKIDLQRTEGEITGKAGDAFRVVFNCDPDTFQKVKRFELRVAEKE